MNSLRPFEWLAALAAGAALMYFLDPVSGRRRRALARDQMVHARHEIAERTHGAVKDLRNRATAAFSEPDSEIGANLHVTDAAAGRL